MILPAVLFLACPFVLFEKAEILVGTIQGSHRGHTHWRRVELRQLTLALHCGRLGGFIGHARAQTSLPPLEVIRRVHTPLYFVYFVCIK